MASKSSTEERHRVLRLLEGLSDELFIRVFRSLMDMRAYPYPDSEVLRERYGSALVLLSDYSIDVIENAMKNHAERSEERPAREKVSVKYACQEVARLLDAAAHEQTARVRNRAAVLREKYFGLRPVLPTILVDALEVLALIEADAPSPPLPSSERLRDLSEKLRSFSRSC